MAGRGRPGWHIPDPRIRIVAVEGVWNGSVDASHGAFGGRQESGTRKNGHHPGRQGRTQYAEMYAIRTDVCNTPLRPLRQQGPVSVPDMMRS
jgi:hypothetical protein